MDQERQRVTIPLREEKDKGVIADIIIAPHSIPAGKNIVVQAHPLLENTKHLEGMNWKDI